MKHLIEINDNTTLGKNVLTMIKAFSDNNKSIKFIEEEDTVSVSDYFKKLNAGITKKYSAKGK